MVSQDGDIWRVIDQESAASAPNSWIGFFTTSRAGKDISKAVVDKVSFTPWPQPGFYRNFQEIGLRQ